MAPSRRRGSRTSGRSRSGSSPISSCSTPIRSPTFTTFGSCRSSCATAASSTATNCPKSRSGPNPSRKRDEQPRRRRNHMIPILAHGETQMTRALAVVALVTCSAVLPLGSQDRPAADRRRYLDTAIPRTTDDPRRTPIAPERRSGPERVVVVRGGRVFDGTGAAAREGTLVITGNRITAILAPNAASTWPRDARVIDAAGKTVMPGLIDLHTHLSYVNPGVDPGRVN